MSNIPSNEQIRTALDNAYAYAKTVQGGKNASYIPALAQVPSDLLAIAVVTVNGDLLTAGSADAPFAIESISKAFNLAYVMDLIEANETFAAQSVAVSQALNFDMSKVNVNGGAIALGHPVGASGARILVTLLYAMKHRGAHKGLATLCIGGGMGCATIVEMD